MNASLMMPSLPYRICILFWLTLLGFPCPALADVVTDFSSGFEGWASTSGVSWQDSGGNPDGYLRFNDGGPADGGNLFAPASYLGDWNRYALGSIELDYRVFSTQSPNFASFILISGPGGTAVRNFPVYTSPTGWINLSTQVIESEWQVTAGNWQAILDQVDTFRVSLANSSFAGEITGVDNIRLASVPEPSGLICVAGLALITWWRSSRTERRQRAPRTRKINRSRTMPRAVVQAFAFALLVLAMGSAVAQGQVFTWTNTNAGNFWNGNNWDTAPFGPDGVDHVAIIGNQPTNAGSFNMAGAGTLGEFHYLNSNPGFFSGGLLNMQTSSGEARFVVGGGGAGRLSFDADISLASSTEFQISNGPVVENTINGLITGNGSLRKTGSGTLVLSSNNAYLGNTVVSQGVLQVGRNAGTGSLGSGAISIGGSGTLRYRRSNSFTVANTISGLAGLIEKEGAGALAFTGDNRGFHGDIHIKSGTIRLGNNSTSGALGTGNVVVGSGGHFEFRRSNHVDIRNLISGSGNVIKNGVGMAVLHEDNTYSGGTIVNSGELRIGTGTSGSAGTGEIVNNATVAFDRSDTYTVTNLISGSGNVVKDGSGTAIFTGANAYSGSTTIEAGTLQIGNNAGAGQIGSGVIKVNSSATLRFSRSNSFTVFGALDGSGTIEKEGFGTVAFAANGSFHGDVNIIAGTIRLGNNTSAGSIGSGAQINTTTGSKLELRRSDDFELRNSIHGDGSLIKNGAGMAILSRNNSYAGGTTINFGELQVGDGLNRGTLGTGGVTNDSVLSFNRNDLYQVGNPISGTGDVIQRGSGTTVLTGNNTYSGSTFVEAGVLKIASNGSIDASASIASQVLINSGELVIDSDGNFLLGELGSALVNDGGQLTVDGYLRALDVQLTGGSLLSGSGLIDGDVQVDVQSGIAPGNSIGTLTFGSDLTLAGELNWEYNSASDTADILAVDGDITLSGATLHSIGLESWDYGKTFTVAAYSGELSGTFSNLDLTSGWSVDYASTTVGINGDGGLAGARYITVTAIPEPSVGSALILFLGCTILSRRRTVERVFHRSTQPF